MKPFFVSRYPEDVIAISNLHHLDDALDIVTFLTAEEFVAEQLKTHHGKSGIAARALSKKIACHARLANQYANVSLHCPPEISFLPGYYSMLNLAKIYSLAGKYSSEFDSHARWHGAKYSSRAKNSRGLLTEEITVCKGGALALFYKTITDQAISGNRTIVLRNVYPIVAGISQEVSMITKAPAPMVFIEFTGELNGVQMSIEATVKNISGQNVLFPGNVRSLAVLKGFRRKPKMPGIFVFSGTTNAGSLEAAAREVLQTQFLRFREANKYPTTYIQNSTLPLPEEFASALVFFHLSSVCRYNPELLEKIMRSECWPMLLAARRHALFDFLLKTWSFITQKNYHLRTS